MPLPKIVRCFSLLLAALFACFKISAQTLTCTINGTITAADNSSLPGATVSIMGIAKTQSGANGTFTLANIPEGLTTLEITMVGKIRIRTQVVVAAGKVTQVNYTMDDDVRALQEVTIGTKELYLKFTDIANLPEPIYNSTYVTDGRYIYGVNGNVRNGKLSKGVLKYDPAANKWAILTQKLTPKFDASAAYVSSVNKIYVWGGLNNLSDINNGVESIDVATGQVEKIKVHNPMPSMSGGYAVWNDKIYLWGGSRFRLEQKQLEGIVSTGASYSSLYVFDPATEKFTQLADMPYAAEAQGAIVNGKLYIFGGYDPFQHKAFNLISVYDISTDTWRSMGKLPVNVSSTNLAVYGDRIFIVGNYDDDTYLGYYDTINNTFTKLRSNLKPRKHASAGIIQNRYLVTFGGTGIHAENYVSAQMIDLQEVFGE